MILEIPLDNVTIEQVHTLDPIGKLNFEDSFCQVSGDRFDFIVPEIAIFSIRAGSSVLIQAHPETSQEILELYLRGTVLAILLFQRGTFCLHASSVVIENKAFLFAGNSGSGKSTTAFLLHKAGYTCLNDDVTPVSISFSGIETRSYTSEMKVDKVLIRHGTNPYRSVPSQAHKVYFKIEPPKNSFEITRMYVFNWGNRFNISEIKGSEKLRVLLQHVFRNEYLNAFPDYQLKFFEGFVRYSEAIDMYLVTKNIQQQGKESVDLLLEHLQHS